MIPSHSRPRHHLRRLVLATTVAGAVAMGTASTGRAAPEPEPISGPSWVLDSDALELTGTSPSTRLDFTVPAGWAPSGPAELVLPYSMGSTAFGTVSVTINDDYVTDAAVDSTGSELRLAIPASDIASGDNSLRIVGDIDLTIDRECADPTHLARRIEFGAASTLTVPLEPIDDLVLDDAPGALVPLGNVDRRLDVHLVGGDVGPLASAAAIIVAAVEEESSDIEVTVTTHGADGFDPAAVDPAYPAIVVGVSRDVDVAASGDRSPAAEIRRSSLDQVVLAVGGDTPTDVVQTAKSLADTSAQPSAEDDDNRSFTLDELGYDDRTLSGPGRDSTVFGFDVPLAAVPAGATVFVDARRSTGVDLDGVGVIVNGERLGVASFDETGRSTDSSVRIPREALRPGRNLVRIDADFDEIPVGCSASFGAQSIEIADTTQIDLEAATDIVDLDLDDLPYVFRDPADSDDLTIVLPGDPTADELNSALRLAALLGADGSPARIAEIEELDDAALDASHLVLMGSPSRQPLIHVFAAEPGSDLDPFAITTLQIDGDTADVDTPEAKPGLGIVRFATRGDVPGRVIMLLSGLDDEGASLATDAVLDVEVRPLLVGGAASLDKDRDGVNVTQLSNAILMVVERTASPPPRPEDAQVDEESADAPTTTAAPEVEVVAEEGVLPDGPPLLLTVGALGLTTLAGAGFVGYRRRGSSSDSESS